MRRIWRHPLSTLALAALLAASMALLPNLPGNRSTMAMVVEELSGQVFGKASRVWSNTALASTCAEFVRGGEGIGDNWKWVDLDQSADVFLQQIQNAHQAVGVCLVSGRRQNGFWAPTTRTDELHMHISPVRSTDTIPTGNDRDQLRLVYAEFLATRPDYQDDAARLLQGEYVHRSIIWTGVLHNIASIVISLLLLFSLAWIRDVPRWFRQGRRNALLQRKLCPKCRYSIEGLTVQTCPECGSSLKSPKEMASNDAAITGSSDQGAAPRA